MVLNAFGDIQKSRDHDFEAVEVETVAPFLRTSIIRLGGRGKVLRSCGIRDSSTVWKATDGNFISSRTSLMVNAA